MSENCTHDCSTCGQSCSERTEEFSFIAPANPGSNVKKVIGVVSGKGGVGKSLVTSLLACAMQKAGHKSAILDADITGPSIPKGFGLEGQTYATEQGMIPGRSELGIDIMSINLVIDDPTSPVVWRGPVIAGAVKQFWTDVVWGDQEYMFVDMPPGTGDVTLTVFQSLPLDGIIVVSTPQELVEMIVSKAMKMAEMMNVPVIGLVENMSYVECPHCGEKLYPFGPSHLASLSNTFGVKATAAIPMHAEITEAIDTGNIEDVEAGEWLLPVIEAIKEI